MPGKTNSNLIIELEKAVAILGVRADTTDATLEDTKKLRGELQDQRDRLVKLEAKLEHLDSQQRDRRAIIIAIVVALRTTVLSAAITKGFDWFSQNRTLSRRAS